MKMNKNDINLLINLLDREIENFQSVYERTGKECWKGNIDNLNRVKEKLNILDNNLYCSDCGSIIESSYILDSGQSHTQCFSCYELTYEQYITND
jgi:hypothetical protein